MTDTLDSTPVPRLHVWCASLVFLLAQHCDPQIASPEALSPEESAAVAPPGARDGMTNGLPDGDTGRPSGHQEHEGDPPAGEVPPPPRTIESANGMWFFKKNLTESALHKLVDNDVFNVYLQVGYPSKEDDPGLEGIVSDSEVGIQITQSEVAAFLQLLAKVDSRLRLWAWFGTWSSLGTSDADGHAKAKIDISTKANRARVISNIKKVAAWGFYGVQDDTEDLKPNSVASNGQFDDRIVSFWNEEADALHSIGVQLVTFTPAVWYNFTEQHLENITGPDYQILVPSNGSSEAEWVDLTARAVQKSSIPVAIDLGGGSSCAMVSGRLDKVFAKLPSADAARVLGYAFYEWGDWNNASSWACRNQLNH